MAAPRLGVALCDRLDLIRIFGPHFDATPDLRLLPPDAVTDPDAVEFALAWRPGADAFRPYRHLRGVFSIAAGTDGITASASLPPDVPVIRLRDDDQALQMAGFAVFQVLWHHRDMAGLLAAQAAHRWKRRPGGASPARVRVGVMGLGHMGRRIARALADLGYDVASLTRRPPAPEPGVAHFTDAERAAFLGRSDILVNVLPMSDETKGMLNRTLFAALPEGAALIHLGRGPQLDEDDLLAALESGRLSGASLDVFAAEPLPKGHPFWDHPRILVTPHIAGEPEPRAVVENVRRHLVEAVA
ncbi:2-hydroxyacid dehydrogenase [Limimaricola pyoseonensis]|uniref:Glyoxylate/hydroxypyruvate reductase A n=1 Tax=Limimaricola pyoseonensis TaxID=521013 RepID=A0A1G7G129_9RHOB|nr:glyoxylate/hydroxypyruvate reductase A [Limimaricola pyoseonensis]SDE81812.1 glyoxylate/hydroxypyruvate reductase A [Limimaricola pyoseonensis]